MKEKANYIFNLKLITLGIAIISIVILLMFQLYSYIAITCIAEVLIWINLTIQEMKVCLLKDISKKIDRIKNIS